MKLSLATGLFFITCLFMTVETISQTDSVFNDQNYPPYKGGDLGLTYSKSKTKLKVWSPTAKSVKVFLYKDGFEGTYFAEKNMKKGQNGTWSVKLKGNQESIYYDFQVTTADSSLAHTPDPYAIATGANGKRAMVVDMGALNPPNWSNDKRPPLKSFADIVLYELHFRDISMHANSGIKQKGKYLGLAETGTKTPDGQSTGLDHIKELGITHVHLLPSFDFRSIDEHSLFLPAYNWGYDPENYNVPEGSYSSNPLDGRVRIREFKQLVKTLHDNGIRVVMDVVYNHTGATEESVFNRMVPGYYYRNNEFGGWANASGCGNETASERAMVRKFMVESMKYWAEEYHIDGFRVDLMGIHDIETMNQVARELRKVDPTIFVYGEGWTSGQSPLPDDQRALKHNTLKLDGIAAFSDDFRDAIKGHVFTHDGRGYASGAGGLMESVKFGVVGAIQHPQVDYSKVNYSKAPWANQPTQCINYASCHDNHTLWDRLLISCPTATEEERLQYNKLAQTMVFTSQGVPFLHAGEEFVRTKNRVENSFMSPDPINEINWDHKSKYHDLFKYYQGLIQMRKNHPAFRMGSADLVRKHLKFLDIQMENVVAFELNGAAVGDSWKRIIVIFNGNKVGKGIKVPEGNWEMVLTNYRIDENGMGAVYHQQANVSPFSALIIVEK